MKAGKVKITIEHTNRYPDIRRTIDYHLEKLVTELVGDNYDVEWSIAETGSRESESGELKGIEVETIAIDEAGQ